MDGTFPNIIHVEAWHDELVEAHGHDPRSTYVETWWLPVLGPTATLLLRRLGAWLSAEPSGFDLDVGATAVALGVGHIGGKGSPLVRALCRLDGFDIARWARFGGDESPLYQIRTALPPLTAARVRRLPESLRRAHAAAVIERMAAAS